MGLWVRLLNGYTSSLFWVDYLLKFSGCGCIKIPVENRKALLNCFVQLSNVCCLNVPPDNLTVRLPTRSATITMHTLPAPLGYDDNY